MTQMNADNQSTNLPIYQSTSLPVSLSTCLPSTLRWDDRGLITTVVQDAASGQVLMVAWMNAEALESDVGDGRDAFLEPQPG